MRLSLCLLALSGLVSSVFAAEHRGVVMFHGVPVPGATVTFAQGDRKLITTTDDNGAYVFANVADAPAKVDVEMVGFTKASREVSPLTATSIDLALAPLRADAQAPRPPAGQAAQQRPTQQMQQQGGGGGGGGMPMGGGGGGGDSFIMAGSLGGSSGSMTQADAFGNRFKNGAVQYNGNASFSLDNSVWDAQAYSLNGRFVPKPAFAKGHVNLSFGGPLAMPRVFKNKGGMFTINYQMGRTRNGTTSSVTVPTLLERAGDFSQSAMLGTGAIVDPLGRLPFAGNRIPTSRMSQTALRLLDYYPSPNGVGSRLNYQTPIVSTGNQDNLNVRVNQALNKKDRLSGSVGYQHSNSRTPNVFGFVDTGANNGINTNISWTHTFSKRLVNTIGYTLSRSRNQLSPYFAERENVAAALGIQGTSGLPLNWGPPTLAFTNYTALSDGNASLTRNQTSAANENLFFKKGNHQLNFGGTYRRQQLNPLADLNGRGTYTFTGLVTSNNGVGGYDLADMLLGLPATAAIRFGNADKYFRSWHMDSYVQDAWQVNKKLTLNYGLRYDYTAPFTERYGRLANLDIAPGYTAISQITSGQSGPYAGDLPSSMIRPMRANIAPSAGMAWRIFSKRPKTPTILRAGYNTMYPLDIYGQLAANLAGQAPFAKVLNVATSETNPLSLQNGFTSKPAVSNTYALDPNYRVPVVRQWMAIGIQVLPRGMYVVAGYVGIDARNLNRDILPNSLPPGSVLPVNAAPSGYSFSQSTGTLKGNLGIVQIARQMASGFTANLSWTMSHATDSAGIVGMSSLTVQDWRNPDAERARSGLIPRHQVNASWQYSTGQGKAGGTLLKGWKGGLMKDWTVNNSLTMRAGMPTTALVGGNLATIVGTGFSGSVRADATGLPIAAPDGSNQPFNLAAFTTPQPGMWGNAGRNTITGPAMFSLNGSLGRVFRLGEQRSVDLRFDATNYINHMTLTGWGTVVNSYNYGLPTGTNPMRSMTANLRFRF